MIPVCVPPLFTSMMNARAHIHAHLQKVSLVHKYVLYPECSDASVNMSAYLQSVNMLLKYLFLFFYKYKKIN